MERFFFYGAIAQKTRDKALQQSFGRKERHSNVHNLLLYMIVLQTAAWMSKQTHIRTKTVLYHRLFMPFRLAHCKVCRVYINLFNFQVKMYQIKVYSSKAEIDYTTQANISARYVPPTLTGCHCKVSKNGVSCNTYGKIGGDDCPCFLGENRIMHCL
jgi:hypothetical protein